MAGMRQSGGSEWRAHGTVLFPSIAGIALVAVHGYSLGVMIAPIEQEFGWSRAEISVGHMITACIALVLAPFVGMAIDHIGPRRIAIIGVIAYCAALGALSTASANVMSWWLRWTVLGLAATIILPTVWMAAINSLFSRHRGKALAFALLGTGLSATVVPGLTNLLVGELGWRGTYLALAVGMGAVVLCLVLAFFYGATDRTRDSGLSVPATALPGLSAREGFTSPAFIKLGVAVLVFGVTILAFAVIAVPVLIAHGLDSGTAAGIAGLIGIGSITGRLAGGFLLDWFEARKVAALTVTAPVVSIVLLLVFPGSPLLAGIALLAMGLALGAEVDACSYLAARHFGMRSFGTLFGAINGTVMFGSGVAPVIANYVYDITGSYDPVLWATVPLCLLAAGLFLSLGAYPDFDEAV